MSLTATLLFGMFGLGFCAGTGNYNNDDDADADDVLSSFIVIGQSETSKDHEYGLCGCMQSPKQLFIPEDHIRTITQNPEEAAEKLIEIFHKYIYKHNAVCTHNL